MAKKRFDLGAYLQDAGVKNEHGDEQIVRIDLDLIVPDPNNFYSLDGIDELAANIETVGLLDALRVRPVDGKYMIVSGHRRRAAILLIRDGGSDMFRDGVPCIVEYGEASDAMRELRMIYANSSTRVMSSADLARQAERTNAVLMELRKQGFEFKGRTRELVAQIMHTSESKIARVGAIRKNLRDTYRLLFDTQRLPEGLAYRLSQEPQEVQKELFEKLGTTVCSLTGEKLDAVIEQVKKPKAEPHEVSPVRPSFDAEAYLAERAEEDRTFFEMLSEEADHFLKELGTVNSRQKGIQLLKENLGRDHSGWLYDRVDVNCSPKGVRLWDANGDSDADITRTWTDVYDMLCIIALNRAAINIGAEPEDVSKMDTAEPEWMTGTPPRYGRYFCKVDMGTGKAHEQRGFWDDGWTFYGMKIQDDWTVVGWWPLPKEG